jgi:pimeloyl-ACP methyl ester carboxylesterase
MNSNNALAPYLKNILSHDGINLSCEIRGNQNKPLVFVHGWTCNRGFFAPQAELFSQSHQVVSLDLAGHGQSGEGRTEWTLANFARDVEAVVNGLELESPILIGHSMGGAVCLEAAQLLGTKITGVVLVDTFAFDYGHFDESQIYHFLDSLRTDFPGAIRGLIEQTTPDGTDQMLREKMISTMVKAPLSIAIPAFESLLRWDALPIFQDLKIPVRCVNGSLINSEACQRYGSFWEATQMPQAGHFLQLEDPDEFNRCLSDMLATI